MIRDHMTLGMQTYLVLIEDNNLGEAPTTLGGGERWYSDDELASRRGDAYTELNKCGVFRGGRVDERFLDTIRVLQRPGVEHYTFATIDGKSITVRTAAIGRDAVLVVCDGETIDLYPGEPEQLPQQLFRALPECPAATVHSMSCAAEDYQAALEGQPVRAGPNGRDARQIARWIQFPRERGGQLFTATRPSAGGRRRSGEPPRWFDTEQGRILAYVDSTGYLNVVPGTVEKFAARLQTLEAELRGR